MDTPQNESTPILNYAEALSYCDEDPELLREIARSFRQNWPESVADLRTALADGDARRLEQKAHALKGRAATLAAVEVTRAALELETLAHNGELANAPAALQTLIGALQRLQLRLQQDDLA